jgi:hypothetical protein
MMLIFSFSCFFSFFTSSSVYVKCMKVLQEYSPVVRWVSKTLCLDKSVFPSFRMKEYSLNAKTSS